MMKSRKVKRDMLVCALVYIITPKTPALAFSIHSIVRSVQACHEKEIFNVHLQQDVGCEDEPNFMYQNHAKTYALS